MPLLHSSPVTSVVIAGAGGFGLEVFDYLHAESLAGGPPVAGFIDDTPGGRAPDGIESRHLGTIDGFRAQPGQVVVVAIGSVEGRRRVHARLWTHDVRTPAYAHPSAIVSPTAVVGQGTIVCPFSILNRNAMVHEGVLVNVHCTVAHGAVVGAYSVLCPYTALNGDARVGDGCFLGTRSTIYPRVSIGERCIVDSHTGVRASAGDLRMISSRGTYRADPIRAR